jgi:deoxyribodipyrimidine photo-lyase
MGRALVWFRRDLRIADNPALYYACQSSREGVVAVFVLTPDQWKQHDDAPAKVDFWLRNLKCLSGNLARLNIPLQIISKRTFADCPTAIQQAASRFSCDEVFANREYEVHERRRDEATAQLLAKQGIGFRQFHDRVIVPPGEIQTKDGRFYSVYTPYRRVWDKVMREHLNALGRPKKQPALEIEPSAVPDRIRGFDFRGTRPELWPAGEDEAHQRLGAFQEIIDAYGTDRDIPAVRGTSLLSPWLAAGVISPHQCVSRVLAACNDRLEKDSGAAVWISELTWRDFYVHVLTGFPRVSRHRPFKEKTDAVPWRDDATDLKAWQTGMTGYPIVDAGMRQLNQMGWMHNRLRMVTAMFLTKHLLIDWRLGEKYFMQHLIDGDLAANNGGWQWSASTGTDAQPWFRIFNPFSQSKRFDPDGVFIRRFCPELAELPAASLHDGGKFAAASRDADYPDYVVDYKQGRSRALAAFRGI